MYFHACARSKIQITAPPDQLSFFAATNEKGRSHFFYIWISQFFSQIVFSLFAPPINSMTTLYHKGERINANFTGALSLTSSNLSDGLLIFSAPLGEQQEVPSLLMLTISSHITSQSNRLFFSAAPLGEQQEARGLGRHLGAGAAGGQGDEGHPGKGDPDDHDYHGGDGDDGDDDVWQR